MGRLQGIVVDQNGNPIKGARVILTSTKAGDTGPDPVVTDAKGRWAAGGLIGGGWNLDIGADGFLIRKISANVSELQGLTPPMKIQLEPKPEEKPKPQEEEEAKQSIQVGGVEISPEIAEAIEKGNTYIREQKWKEAAAEYEKAIAVLSTNTQVKFALARAYHGAGELKKAIAQLRDVYGADSGNMTAATLLVDMLLEDGQLDEAKKILGAMPPGALSDPNTILNIGIRFINHNKPDEAYKYFNDAVSVAPDVAATYYYRAIAALQMKKMKEAKADLQKILQIAPDSSEAKDARELLAQMK
ncbi:MAG TPA: tetratricopeptide repeat protein [Thermoanaerobaculia bacterium]|nr:tetratricopeptide repeat protein [Thermoanaerobaculia bacterium]